MERARFLSALERSRHGSPRERSRAEGQIIQENEGLVKLVMRKFRNQGVASEDLLQSGREGLLVAIRRFDATRGKAFSTYAIFYIRERIQRTVMFERTVSPPQLSEKLAKEMQFILRHVETLRAGQDREPPLAEVMSSIKAEGKAISLKLTGARVEALLATKRAYSVEYQDERINPFVAIDEPTEGIEREATMRREWPKLRAQVYNLRKIAQALPPRSSQVVCRRLPFLVPAEPTLAEVGRELGITKQRVQQLERAFLTDVRKRFQLDREELLTRLRVYWEIKPLMARKLP